MGPGRWAGTVRRTRTLYLLISRAVTRDPPTGVGRSRCRSRARALCPRQAARQQPQTRPDFGRADALQCGGSGLSRSGFDSSDRERGASASGQAICRLAGEAADAADPEVALEALTRLREELEQFERQQVARALTAGRSFGAIARALGISRQAVHRRFSGLSPHRRLSRGVLPSPEVRLVFEYAG